MYHIKCVFSCEQLFVIPRTVACQAPLSMEFFRQEYWSGLPFPPPGDLPNPGIEPVSPALAGRFFTAELPDNLPRDIKTVCSCCLVAQLCLTLCNPVDCHPPGSPVPGILQARTLEWVAISLSNAGK